MNRQRGALTFIVPLIMVTIVLFGTLAIDGARLYSLRQEMQSQVNAAVTAAADGVQTCGGQAVDMATIRQRALIAARAQGFDGEDTALVVRTGLLEDGDADGELEFRTVPFLDQSNAVHVSYQRSTRISMLLPESRLGRVDMEVSAAVRKEVVATISASGGTLAVDSGILGGLLGAVLDQPGYSLDPTSLSSLRNTTVRLGDLLNELGVNTVAEILPLGADELAGALRSVAGATSPVGDLLDDLAVSSGIETVKISDILNVVESANVPASSEFPLYDTVISLVLNLVEELQESESDGLLYLPLNVNLGLPGVATVNATVGLHVGKPSSIAIGPARLDSDGEWVTQFYAPDITLMIKSTVRVLSLPGASVGVADINLPLAVNAGGGHGKLVSARCARGTDNDVLLGVDIERELAGIVSGQINKDSGEIVSEPIEIGLLKLIPLLPVLEVRATIDGAVPGMGEKVFFEPGYPLYCSEQEGCAEMSYQDSGGGLAGLDLNVDVDDAKLLGLNLGWLLNPLLNGLVTLLDDVVGLLASGLINPLLNTLGVGLGSISVTVTGANQNNIQLVEGVGLED